MDIYSLREVAQQLRISEPTARDLLRSGQLRSVRVGSQWRVTDQAVREFLHEDARQPHQMPRRARRQK
jgi:excisionase family DNA binding protein